MRTLVAVAFLALGVWLIVLSFSIGRRGDEYISRGVNMMEKAMAMQASLERGD